MVPVHLDALLLKEGKGVVQAMADFSCLPYNDGTKDVNSEIANISEEIVYTPFQDENLFLKPGIHLHWALPDALTRGAQTAEGTVFPEVPNRWLVTRSSKGADGRMKVEKQWIVESDYLYPDGSGDQSGSVSSPYPPDKAAGKHRPFRYLGRNMPLSAWGGQDAAAEYLKPLTAVGYGEPAFAAFYPNCHSVFGFHDNDYSVNVPEGLQYDVIGWYSDGAVDYLRKLVNSFTSEFQKQNNNALPTNDDLRSALEQRSQWKVTIDSKSEFPNRMLCYARLTFGKLGSSIRNPIFDDQNAGVTVADTGTEALSVYLASQCSTDREEKRRIEDQLEAVQLSDRLGHRQLDVGPKFIEARHEKGFTAVDGGALWTVSLETQQRQADAGQSDAQMQITLPKGIAGKLTTLNRLQHDFENASWEIESLRKQLFSDWYKYMLCAYPSEDSRDDYPNIDEVKHYIETKGIEPLWRKVVALGRLELNLDGDEVAVATTTPGTLAAKLAQAISELQLAITEHNNNPDVRNAGAVYRLKQIPAPRYWQPNEPVVLITGLAAEPTDRHGQDGGPEGDGSLDCQPLANETIESLLPNRYTTIGSRLDQINSDVSQERTGFNLWVHDPWHPLMLEWEVEVFPAASLCNTHADSGRYDPDFIIENFNLKENDVDLSVREGKGAVTKAANVYCGSSILTPQAGIQLKRQMESYLEEQVLDDYYEAMKVPQEKRSENYFSENITAILGWYKQAQCGKQPKPALCNIIRAYELLISDDLHSLSQSLGGFNEALIMHKQTAQLAISDPLGFDDYQSFSARVSAAVGASIRSAPEPSSGFNPIRSGALKLLRLRLVDTFGQVKEISCDNVITAEKTAIPLNPGLMALPPRITQPARINFRWLSASRSDQEMNDHPATSPICGWILPNNLDNSLLIYDSDGKPLGSINQTGVWWPAPGNDVVAITTENTNPQLSNLVAYLRRMKPEFLSDFISAINNALENIEPERYANHQDLALLMGQPIALVRASVHLELQGLPAIHQGWDVFRHDLRRLNRETSDFIHVKFPIRLGEYRQFNDGLVGYWKEKDGKYEDDTFYAPQIDLISHEQIKTHADHTMVIEQTVESLPQTLAMLIDPRGYVHATSGIAPCKAIDIPPDQYADALSAIEVTFFSAPILTNAGEIALPLPAEPGYKWAWLQNENGAWLESSPTGKVDVRATFSTGQEIREGWLKLSQA
jgi:hypothetical protein